MESRNCDEVTEGPNPLIAVHIPTRNNKEGLLLCLAALLNANADSLPHSILVNIDSEVPEIGFYLEQMMSLAKHRRVNLGFAISPGGGIRAIRDDILNTHKSLGPAVEGERKLRSFLCTLMLDDDVLVAPDALARLKVRVKQVMKLPAPFKVAAIQGTKPDVNNRRGYKNFNVEELPTEAVQKGGYNFFYPHRDDYPLVPVESCDTGFLLLLPSDHSVSFTPFSRYAVNAGGEDLLFAQGLKAEGYSVLWAPDVRSVHLEKPVVRFGGDAYRKEAAVRAADHLGYDIDPIDKAYIPWEPIRKEKS